MSLSGGDVMSALVRFGLTRRGRNVLEARPSEVPGDAGAQRRALGRVRRRAGLAFGSKGQSGRNVSARAGR